MPFHIRRTQKPGIFNRGAAYLASSQITTPLHDAHGILKHVRGSGYDDRIQAVDTRLDVVIKALEGSRDTHAFYLKRSFHDAPLEQQFYSPRGTVVKYSPDTPVEDKAGIIRADLIKQVHRELTELIYELGNITRYPDYVTPLPATELSWAIEDPVTSALAHMEVAMTAVKKELHGPDGPFSGSSGPAAQR